MKTAVVYYSYEGNSVLVAEIIKAALKADVFEIKTQDTKIRDGFSKYAWGGAQVFMHKKPKLMPLPAELDSYDLIILGTPVWAWSPSPAIVSFITENNLKGKKIALFCCHGGGPGKTLEKLKTLLKGNTFVGEIDFQYPSKMNKDELKQKIEDWAKTLST